jgi:hypothetical protein
MIDPSTTYLGLLQHANVPPALRGNRWLVEGFARFSERLPIAARLLGTANPSRTANVVLPLNTAFGSAYFRDDVPTFLNASTSMLEGYQHSSYVFDYFADLVALQGGDWRAGLRDFLLAAGTQTALDAVAFNRLGLTFGELFSRARIALYLDDIGTAGLPPWTQYHQFQLRTSRPAGALSANDPRNAWTPLHPGYIYQLNGTVEAGAAWGFIIDGCPPAPSHTDALLAGQREVDRLRVCIQQQQQRVVLSRSPFSSTSPSASPASARPASAPSRRPTPRPSSLAVGRSHVRSRTPSRAAGGPGSTSSAGTRDAASAARSRSA